MCDTLQLTRVSQHRSMKQWRQESLEEVRACMSRWVMEYQAWVEEIAERWSPCQGTEKEACECSRLITGSAFQAIQDTPPRHPGLHPAYWGP